MLSFLITVFLVAYLALAINGAAMPITLGCNVDDAFTLYVNGNVVGFIFSCLSMFYFLGLICVIFSIDFFYRCYLELLGQLLM